MTHDEIRAAVNAGRRAADVARDAGVPITVVHRIANWRGSCSRAPLQIACDKCGHPTNFRGGIYAMCSGCRSGVQKARSAATLVVRKAVNVGMLKPATEHSCVDCGGRAEQYEHRDYSRPLAVDPVCRSCNAKRGAAA